MTLFSRFFNKNKPALCAFEDAKMIVDDCKIDDREASCSVSFTDRNGKDVYFKKAVDIMLYAVLEKNGDILPVSHASLDAGQVIGASFSFSLPEEMKDSLMSIAILGMSDGNEKTAKNFVATAPDLETRVKTPRSDGTITLKR